MGDEAASDIDDGAQRVTVSLPKEAMEFLRAESNRTGSSMGEIVRRTIANQIFLQSATERGADLLLAEKGKPTNRVVFRQGNWAPRCLRSPQPHRIRIRRRKCS